jgi:outer membrane murein-binding lipoprotein Lpp
MDRDEIASALRELEAKVRRLEDEQVEELKRVQTKVKYNY